eukprot:s2336_g11.t1
MIGDFRACKDGLLGAQRSAGSRYTLKYVFVLADLIPLVFASPVELRSALSNELGHPLLKRQRILSTLRVSWYTHYSEAQAWTGEANMSPDTCRSQNCLGRLQQSMVSGVCVYRCQEKAHHWLFPTLTAEGQVQYVYTTRGLAQLMRDGKQLMSDWKAVEQSVADSSLGKETQQESTELSAPIADKGNLVSSAGQDMSVALAELPSPKTPKDRTVPVKDAKSPESVQKHPCEKPVRPGFSGRVKKALFCKNKACGIPRDQYFRNALCPDCTAGFRASGRSRCEANWTPEMCASVAKESQIRRQERVITNMTSQQRFLHETQLEILAELRQSRSQ